MKKTLTLLALAALATLNVRAADETGFVPLFNGKDITGWKLRRPAGNNSWTVEAGVLKNTVNTGEHGTDLVTDKKFWNFTVRYEFMVPDNSNSGFYLVAHGEVPKLLVGDEIGAVVADKKFWNFTVRYEFMVPDNSNSGFYLRGRHEIQILGDYKSGKPDIHGN